MQSIRNLITKILLKIGSSGSLSKFDFPSTAEQQQAAARHV